MLFFLIHLGDRIRSLFRNQIERSFVKILKTVYEFQNLRKRLKCSNTRKEE